MTFRRFIAAIAIFAGLRGGLAIAQEQDYGMPPTMYGGAYGQEMPAVEAGPDYTVRDLKAPVQPTFLGCLYTRFEGIALKRERRDRVFLGEQDNVATGQVLNEFTTKDVPFPYEPGLSLLVGLQTSNCDSLELSFFGLQDWKKTVLFPNQSLATNALFSPYLSVGSFADAFSFTYRSELANAELNWQHQVGLPNRWSGSILAGLRYIHLHETFSLSGNESVFSTFERTAVRTHNNLAGFQLGGELAREVGKQFSFSIHGKAGIYANIENERTSNALAGPFGASTNLDTHETDVSAATELEVGIALRYHIHTNIVIGVGYQVMFLNSLALAPDQLTSTNFDIFSNTITPGRTGRSINDNGSLVFHGPTAGIEITWGGGKHE